MRSFLAVVLAIAPIESAKEYQFKLTPHTANTLFYLYDNLQVEFAFCAHGKKQGKVVTITYVTFPVITHSTAWNVNYHYESCNKRDLLGIGHSHLAPSECNLSRLDVYSFLYSPFDYAFLVCPNRELQAYVKREVRQQLLNQGILHEALTWPR